MDFIMVSEGAPVIVPAMSAFVKADTWAAAVLLDELDAVVPIETISAE